MSSKKTESANPICPEITSRHSVLARFRLEDIQHLDGDDLSAAQQLCGHGATRGYWDSNSGPKSQRHIDLAKCIRRALDKLDLGDQTNMKAADELLDEAVSTLTRICILLRLAPISSHSGAKTSPLKSRTVAYKSYTAWPTILALAIRRKTLATAPDKGIFCHLTSEDLHEIAEQSPISVEVDRLFTLADKGLWLDIPERRLLATITDPASKPAVRKPERISTPHAPLPQDWLSEIGPRVLWVVDEMAPNLIQLLKHLREPLAQEHFWEARKRKRPKAEKVSQIIIDALARDPWLDSAGQPLVPPFELKTAGNPKVDNFEWPIRTWENVLWLSTIVQAAHLFIGLLATSGRIGEVKTLNRSCIEVHTDDAMHVRGRTYKLSWAPSGMSRTWPAPTTLVKALGQQAELAAAWDWLPVSLSIDRPPAKPQFGEQLWVSIGITGNVGPDADISLEGALEALAERLSVDTRPGGRRVHPHRFRKTVARLAGIALWKSPLVLKQLLGHKNIEMTLHYILSDPGIREEAEKVLRELRIMHCADTLERVREALKAGLPSPVGGVGGIRLADAITEHETRELQSQRQWSAESAQELAEQYTMNGEGWRLGVGFICSKLPHEAGECRKGASRRGEHGEPLISNCKMNCPQRIDLPTQIGLARQKRDAQQVCDGYIEIATTALRKNQLLVAAYCLNQLEDHLAKWPDLRAQFDGRSDLQAIVAALSEEPELQTEAAHG